MRLIDADKADIEMISCYYGGNCYIEDVQEWLNEQPTIDAVEAVRCKDCRYWHEDILACEYLPRSENGTRPAWYGDDFCSYGERRNDDL